MVIPEVPVGAGQEADIRSQRDDLSAWLEAAVNLRDGGAQHLLVEKMLEEIAREDDIQGPVLQRPAGRAILLEECYPGVEFIPAFGIKIHAEFRTGANLIDELAPAAAKVEHRSSFRNERLEKRAGEHFPNLFAILLHGGETQVILPPEFFRGCDLRHGNPC